MSKPRGLARTLSRVTMKSFVLLLFLVASCQSDSPRDFILSIDTSGSMFQGNSPDEKMINRVKDAIEPLVDLTKKDDRVYLISFDDGVQTHLDFEIQDESDKQMIIETVRSFDAKGAYTDMGSMVLSIREYLIERHEEDRDTFVIILSDGIDDPNPQRESSFQIQLEDLAIDGNKPIGSFEDTYIYYLSVGLLVDEGLIKDLEGIAPDQVRTIEDGDPSSSIASLINDLESKRRIQYIENLVKEYDMEIGILIMLIILLLFIRIQITRNKVKGKFFYYNRKLGSYTEKSFVLDRLKKHRVVIGSKIGVDLLIRGLKLKKPLVLRAVNLEDGFGLIASKKSRGLISYSQQKEEGKISIDDRFSIGDFDFRYAKKKRN